MKQSGLYIQLFSIHGLIKGEGLQLGHDADTGGQVKYVVELTKALAQHPDVAQVDLVTRLIVDKAVSPGYSELIEPLGDKARIIRIQCGGRKYIRKELLWPYLDEFVDKMLKFVRAQGMIPDVFHGHYADGGYVAKELASTFGMPFIFTGHSMGRNKKNKLLEEGLSSEEINRKYHIDHRIKVEERIIKEAEQIITSTRQEIDKQYGLYENFSSGRYMVLPPGIDTDVFYPYYSEQVFSDLDIEVFKEARRELQQELQRFWVGPQKPFILALCRPDQRKNISGLVTAYGEDKELQKIANLAIFAGVRKNISSMEENERSVLTEMLLLMDRYDLYGKMAIPKKHDFTIEVPELYRLCAESGGVFVNPALVEPFGLTLIEAASCGLPIIATKDGGPEDIIGNCKNGILVNPTNTRDIAAACMKILKDPELWENYSKNGIEGVWIHYSWESHCDRMVQRIHKVQHEMPHMESPAMGARAMAVGQRFTRLNKLLITDIDNTLVGDEAAMGELFRLLKENEDVLGWGVATGRCLDLTLESLEENNIPRPEVIVCSVGTEIYYGQDLAMDNGWQQHLSYKWRPDLVQEVLAKLDFLEMQEPKTQRRYKISYYMEDDPELLAKVHRSLQEKRIRYHLVYSHGQFLDILPYRASKGKAVRYLSYKWGIPLPNIMVCGDSGNDESMLRGDTSGVVVGNYSKELEILKGLQRTYFSKEEYAAGIMDGLRHYGFITENRE